MFHFFSLGATIPPPKFHRDAPSPTQQKFTSSMKESEPSEESDSSESELGSVLNLCSYCFQRIRYIWCH